MSRLTLRERLKAIAIASMRFTNSPTTKLYELGGFALTEGVIVIIPYRIFLYFLEPKAEGIYKSIAKSTAKFLKTQNSMNGNENAWEDFKEQVVGQHSIFWNVYVKTCEMFIYEELKKLEEHVLLLLYINTKEFDGLSEEEQEGEGVDIDAVVDTAFNKLYQIADDEWGK